MRLRLPAALTTAGLVAGLAVPTFVAPVQATDASGLARFQACTPPTDAFVSLEAAPEVTGPIPLGAGLHRLWDLGVGWKDINPAPGQFRWDVLDAEVAQVEASGSRPMLVLGLTPPWAAANPNAGDPRWGLGTASPPRDNADWQAYVQAVVDRYGDRIAAYEVWNEANLQTFWQGTPGQMAQLTREAYSIIKASRPNAIVLAPSVTTRLRGPMRTFMRGFLPAMNGLGNPFDAFAIHTYPAGDQGPEGRVADVTNWQSVVVDLVGPDSPLLDRPVWDTEVNYGLAGPGTRPGRAYSDAEGAALLAQTFVDSQRLGIDATFWYLYTAAPYSLLGVQLWSGTPTTLAYWAASRRVFAPGTSCPASADASPFDVDAALALRPPSPAPLPGAATVSVGDGAAAPATAPATAGGRVTVSGGGWSLALDSGSVNSRWAWSAYPGDAVQYRASGLAPDSRVYLWETTTGAFLGAGTADAGGIAAGVVELPTGLTRGNTSVQVNGFSSTGSVRSVTTGLRILPRATSPARSVVAFADGSAEPDSTARSRLSDLVAALPPDTAVTTTLTAALPAGASRAERRLARDRSVATAKVLRGRGLVGPITRAFPTARDPASPATRSVSVAITF